ncbi:hypothetical protein GCM10009827_086430 [Dactylosporangium maewongense]|uniref:Uncharacterized protein n=1 Tax=Dactylosporangium maewongense TaxID=634393 RepID=A0ABN2C6S0_9ACTN
MDAKQVAVVEACTTREPTGNSAPLLARRGQARGFDSPADNARPAQRTGDEARSTAHHRVQIHDGEGGQGALRVSGRLPAAAIALLGGFPRRPMRRWEASCGG